MWPYLLVTGVIVMTSILFPRQTPNRVAWAAASVTLVLFIGLRHKVGMDWNNYLLMSKYMGEGSLIRALGRAEPGYALLLWSSTKAGLGVYGANLVGSVIFTAGLFRCARATNAPWLALAVAMPMLVIVVAMSANRQTIAIGVLLWLVATWYQTPISRRVLITLLAASFHYSAAFFLLFVVLDVKMRPAFKLALGAALGAALIALMQYSGAIDTYDQLYLSGQSAVISPGATQHVLLNGLPALAVFMRRRLRERVLPGKLLVWMAWMAAALIPLAFIFSTAAGRLTLYLFPVSMFVLSGMTRLLGEANARAALRLLLGFTMLGVLAVWLIFANSSPAHIPYENMLLFDRSKLAL